MNKNKYIKKSIPLFCPICEFAILPERDHEYFKKFSCCSQCAMSWAESDFNRWKKGWRPSDDEILKEVENRRRQFSSFYF